MIKPKGKTDKPLEVNEQKQLPNKPKPKAPVDKKNGGVFRQLKDKITGNNENNK